MPDSADTDSEDGYFEIVALDDFDGLITPNAFRLAKASLSAKENTPGEEFSLRFTLGCGTASLTGAGCQYVVNLRQCIVEMETPGCTADLSSAYSYELPSSSFSITEIDEGSTSASTEKSASVDAGLNVKLKSLVFLGLSGKWLKSKKSSGTTKVRIEGKRRVMLISARGNHWVVGDDIHGDPRNHRGHLSERYFNEDKEATLCKFRFNKGVQSATVRVIVKAKMGHFVIDAVNAQGIPSRETSKSQLENAQLAIKERLRGIAVSKWIHEKQRSIHSNLPLDELIVTASSVKAVRAKYTKVEPERGSVKKKKKPSEDRDDRITQ